MHAIRQILIVVAVTLLAASAGGAALADPPSTPSLVTNVGVGCDVLFNQLAAGFDATHPAYPVACFNSTGSSPITTKALNSSDTSCELARPDGSSAGIAALNADQTDANKVSGQSKIYCIDWAESYRAPNTTTFEDAFVVVARDGIAWSFPKVSGETNPQPKSLDQAQLAAIYTCKDTNWDQVGGKDAPIGVVVPQAGSDTRATWLLELGITASSEPCWQNGTVTVKGTTDVIEENTGLSAGNVAQFTKTQDFGTTCAKGCAPTDDLFPYSIADNIAQGPLTKGVGGHATSIWGHGNLTLGDTDNVAGVAEKAITTNSSGQPVINPSWNPEFLRILYGVTRNGCYVPSNPTSTAVCLPSTTPPAGGTAYPVYEATGLKAFFGTSAENGWICSNATAKADIVSYGFTRPSNCGAATAGD
jgi:ABC-type phosphate transport system substrate-binding protein